MRLSMVVVDACSMPVTMREDNYTRNMVWTGIVEPWTIHESELICIEPGNLGLIRLKS